MKTTLVSLNVINVFMAFVSTFCTTYILKDNLYNLSISNSILSVFFFLVYYILFKHAVKLFDRSRFIISSILGFIFSAFMVFGKNIYIIGSLNLLQIKTWALIIAFSPVFCALVSLCFEYLPLMSTTGSSVVLRKSDKKRFLIIWCVIFLAWMPVLLASYPGIYGYDSIYQINYYRSGVFNLHHPIAHTYLLGFFVITLGGHFGNYEAGMCCYAVFQMLCLSATFSIVYTYYISKRLKKWLSIAVLLMFMFLPTNPILAISATKDVLFAAFFTLTVMLLLMLAENPQRIKSVKFVISLIICFFLDSIFRNQGKYIVILFLLFMLIAFWKYKKQILLIIISFSVLIGVYNGPVTKALNGVPGNSLREMMSVPCVQLSRAAIRNRNELTEEEIQSIESYISTYREYDKFVGNSDAVKNHLDTEKIKNDPMKFVGLWVRIGLKCPLAYMDAFARLTVGCWYPDMNYRDLQAWHPYWEYYPSGAFYHIDETEYLLLKQTPVKGFGVLNKALYFLTYHNAYQKLPLVSMLFSSALPFWCLLIVLAYKIYKKQFGHLIPIVFALLFVATLLLGPVVLYRYVYPLYPILPLLICFCSANNKKEEV